MYLYDQVMQIKLIVVVVVVVVDVGFEIAVVM